MQETRLDAVASMLFASVLAAIVFGALQWTRAWDLVEAVAFDYLSVVSAPDVPDIPVTVVGIDEESFAEIGKPWPWPRSLHGKLLQEVKEAGASVVVFDIVFAEAGAAREDREFADAIRRHGGAVLAGDISYREDEKFRKLTRVEPHPQFRAAGSITGFANVEVDDDQVVRRMPGDPQSLWRAAVHTYTGGRVPGTPPPGALVRYRDFAASFDYVSYYQALDPAQFLPPGAFEGRIVLVGLNVKNSPAASQRMVDSFATPFTRITRNFSPGVEVQAQIIATALKRDWITPLRWWQAGLCNVLLIVLAAWFMLRWHPLRSAGYAALLMAMTVAISWAMFKYARHWWPPVGPVAAIAAVWLVRGGAAFLEERRRRLQIKRAFAQFVPAEFVETFERNAGNFVSARQSLECACVTTDAAHFTTLAEKMRPQDLAELLNRYFDRLFRPVAHNGGLISDVVGDAILALWPVRDEQTRASVCRALLEMFDASTEFSGSASGGLSTRFGADLGPVSLGVLGGQEHYEYRAVGDPVNTSNRLQELNKKLGTRILVSKALVAGLDEFLVRDLGRFLLRGKNRAVHVYELLGPRAGATPHAERLCAQFSSIADAIGASDLSHARKLLQQIVAEHPDDTPAPVLLRALERPGAVREGAVLLD